MAKEFNKGFTLIELLVVIAIIGVLAAIVLASLGGATGKGTDAKIKQQLNGMTKQAELYTGATTAVPQAVCSTGGANLFGTANSGLGNLFAGLNLTNSQCSYAGGNLPSNGGAWAVSVSLASGAWCVDSTAWSNSKTKAGVNYTTPALAISGNTCQ